MNQVTLSPMDPDIVELCCPICGAAYLHHNRVDVFQRDGEDEDGTQTSVGRDIKITRVKSKDLPGRRDSLVISFWCEQGHSAKLLIYQHKGSTYLSWQDVDGEPGQ